MSPEICLCEERWCNAIEDCQCGCEQFGCECVCHENFMRNPFDTRGFSCDLCGNSDVATIYRLSSPLIISGSPRFQLMGCNTCTALVKTKNLKGLVANTIRAVRKQNLPIKSTRIYFEGLFKEFLSKPMTAKAIEPIDIFNLQIARATTSRTKCSLRTGHPTLGQCLDIAIGRLDLGVEKKPGCLICIAASLGFNELKQLVGHPQLEAL